MKLFSYWRSTAAYRVRIALNLKEIDHEILPVNLLQHGHQSDTYLSRNPQGLVPTLSLDAVSVTQSTAIIEYLEETYPEPSLLPADPIAKARVRAFCQTIACDIHPLNNMRVLHYLREELSCDEVAVKAWYENWVSSGFAALETQVKETAGRYCFSDVVTMADAYLVPQMFNARRFACDLSPYPALVEITSRLEQLPAFVNAAPAQQPDAVQ